MCAILASATMLATPLAARADDVADEADHLFSIGADRYQERDYKGALQYFLASNRLVRNRHVMYNIARTYENLRQLPDAFRYYNRAAEGETDAAAKARIREAIARVAPSVALLRVETDPPGALVYVDRKDLGDRGTAPQTLALAPGAYTIIAEVAGYDAATSARVEVKIGSERAVALKLTRITGTVRIAGARGAQVRVDTDDAPVLCEAPCDAAVPPGPRVIVLSKPGFRTARIHVAVRAKVTSEVRPELEPETGSLVVNADERDATIEVDGRTQGFTPSVIAVPVGKHVVRVALRGFRPVERTVEVRAREQTPLDVRLLPADAVEAASRVAEPVEDAPASVTLIPSPELHGMHYPTVAEAVRGVRGVYVSDDRAYKSVGFRGFGRPADYGNRVLVLVDGHPTNDNWIWSSYVGYDLRTDIEDVDRIEVIRGPGSVLYGTGAFSGVLNLVTAGRDTPPGKEVGVSVAEDGVARARVRLTHRFSSDAGVTTTLSGGKSRGIDLYSPEYLGDSPPSVAGMSRGLDALRVGTWTGRTWYKTLSAQWSFNHHDKNTPNAQFDTLFGDARLRQRDTRAFIEAKLEPRLGDVVESVTRVHGNYYGFRGSFPYAPDAGGLESVAYDGAWAGLEERLVLKPLGGLRITGGGEAQYHFLAHDRSATETQGQVSDDSRPFSLLAGYAMVDAVPSRALKLSGAARVDAYSTFGASVNPRLAVIVKPYEGGTLKFLGGKAFRAPSFYELAGDGALRKKSTNLGAENLYSTEIELSHRFNMSVVGVVSVYSNYITNLIALRNLPGSSPAQPSYSYANTDVPVGTVGGELELRREWKDGYMVAASYSFQKSRYLKSSSFGDFLSFAPSPDLGEVPNAPEHLASLKGGVPILARALMVMTRLSFSGRRFDRNDVKAPGATPQGTTPGAILWDVVFSGGEPRLGLTYAIGVYNAFDTSWRVPVSSEFRQTSMPQLGRTFLALGALTL